MKNNPSAINCSFFVYLRCYIYIIIICINNIKNTRISSINRFNFKVHNEINAVRIDEPFTAYKRKYLPYIIQYMQTIKYCGLAYFQFVICLQQNMKFWKNKKIIKSSKSPKRFRFTFPQKLLGVLLILETISDAGKRQTMRLNLSVGHKLMYNTSTLL